jgi:outer membrane protein OmpA-like peptidoglycan-associated protein
MGCSMSRWWVGLALAVSLLAVSSTHAQTGRDGGIIPPVFRRQLPSQPQEQEIIPFGAGEAALPAAALHSLDKLAARMRAQPRARVILYGFADPQEYTDESYGRQLALRRAEAARDYLLLNGIILQRARLEAVLPPETYNPPLASGLRRPASYVMASLLPWTD